MNNPFLIDLKEKVIKRSEPTSDNRQLIDALKSAEEKGVCVNGENLDYCAATDCEVRNIKNWLRYRLRCELKCGMNECDVDDNVFKMFNLIFDTNNSSTKKINDKYRTFKIKNIILETDTMNSFATLFNQFVRERLPQKWNEYYPTLFNVTFKDALGTDFYRDLYFLLNIEDWYKSGFPNPKSEGDTTERKVLNEFNIFASLTHCLADMILVPFNYNMGRSGITKDFWDLTLIDLQGRYTKKQHYDAGFTFVCENMEKLLLTDWFEDMRADSFDKYIVKPLFNGHSFQKIMPKTNDEYLECVKGINQMIEKRATRLFEVLPDFTIV